MLDYNTIFQNQVKKADTKRNTAHRFLSSTTGQLSKPANWILPTAETTEGTQKNQHENSA